MKTLEKAIKSLPPEEDVIDKVRWFFNGDANRLPYISVWVSSVVDSNIGSLPVPRVTIVVDSSKINLGYDYFEDEVDQSVEDELYSIFRRLKEYVRDFAHLDYPESVEVKIWSDLRRTDWFLPKKYMTKVIDFVITCMTETIDEPALEEIVRARATCVYRGKDAVIPNVVARVLPKIYQYRINENGSVEFFLPEPHSDGDQWSEQWLVGATDKTVSTSYIGVFESVSDMRDWLDSITENSAHLWEYLPPLTLPFRFSGVASDEVCLPVVVYRDYRGNHKEQILDPSSAVSDKFIEPIVFVEQEND